MQIFKVMQEQINRKRFILLAVLTAATLFAMWWVQPENHLAVDETLFRIPDLDQISKVELRTSGKDPVLLEFDGTRWQVNSQYKADGNMVRVLFATLQQAKPKRPVSEALRDSIFDSLTGAGVKVALYAGPELRKEFYAGGNAAKTQAFFADPETKAIYVMTIPGYRVYVSGILELDVSGWRDKFVFAFNWRNFKSLEARFPETPSANFTVSMQKDFFGINGLPEADTSRLNTFLDDVSLLTVEEYLSEPELIDSLKGVTPEMEIVVSDIGDRRYGLKLFDPGASREAYGLIQDSQAALFDRRKIQALRKPRSFFRKK